MKKRNVLVFPAGTEIGLEICRALLQCKEVQLFGAGQDISNHGKFVYPEYHDLPNTGEPDWLPRLISLCNRLAIDYIFPAHDDVIVALSREQNHIPAAVLTAPKQACIITRSKSATYKHLGDVVRVPQLYPDIHHIPGFPLLVKPDRGQGSFGIRKIHDFDSLCEAISAVPDPLICEYLPGEEYTVDCFSDRDRGVLFAGARRRCRIRNGISVNTVSEALPDATALAEIIGHELELHGAWFFQLKRATDGNLALLEVAPRIAGSMAVHRVAGINFPLLCIYEHERLPLQIHSHHDAIEMDRALCNRYNHPVHFRVLYVDLDDTLLLNGQVNTQIVKLIFQCINQGKSITLLTRHNGDLAHTLAHHRLTGLFDKIVHLAVDESKAQYVTEPDAILVDDSFAERMAVADQCGILTFDCSMVEMLTEQSECLNKVEL
ncbi:MAG: ATP-grasp domain-containing protein [Desulfobulbus sp.]